MTTTVTELEKTVAEFVDKFGKRVNRFSRRVDKIIADAAARDAEYKAAEEKRKAEREQLDARLKAEREQLDARLKAERAEDQRKNEVSSRKMEEAIRKSVNTFEKNWGNLVESLVNNQVVDLFVARGIPVTDGSAQNVHGKIEGKSTEIDMVLVNSDTAVVIEVKTTLHKSDVNHILWQLKNFRAGFRAFTIYEKIIGGVAYIRAKPEVVQYAQKNGLFTILATGDSAKIMNDLAFEPKKWGEKRNN